MTGWLAGNMLWASVAMLLVLAVRRPVASLFGAGPAYALWLLPAGRLLMPPLPALGADTPSLLPSFVVIALPEAGAPLATSIGAGWLSALLAAWLAGAMLFLAWQWLSYRRFLTGVSLASRSLGGHAGLPLVESAAVQGPLALGLLDRRIVVPADFAERYSEGERRLALDHESVHHRRGDIWCNLAALLILALNWFNPIAWFAFRAFREDQELACDAAVTRAAAPHTREAYARALIKSASRPGLIAACPLNRADQLKRRLKMMKHHRSSRLRLFGGAAAVTLLAGATAMLGSPGLAHPHPEGESKERSERFIIMTHKSDAPTGEARRRSFELRRGEGGQIHIPDCDDGERTEVDEAEGNERTRVVLCTGGNATPAERADRLQRARERLAGNDDLSEEQRARVTAAIDREIARLRGQ